jgi:Rod binding domain-containing protein
MSVSSIATPAGAIAALAARPHANAPGPSAAMRAPIDGRGRAREQSVEFESMFLSSMFNQMFTSMDGDGPFGGGGKAGVWRSFLTDEYAKSFAKAGGIGIADHVYRALLLQQEARAR